MAQHDFVVKGKREGGSGFEVQRCTRCGLEVWPDSLKKEVAGQKWELLNVPPRPDAIQSVPDVPDWLPSEASGWRRV